MEGVDADQYVGQVCPDEQIATFFSIKRICRANVESLLLIANDLFHRFRPFHNLVWDLYYKIERRQASIPGRSGLTSTLMPLA